MNSVRPSPSSVITFNYRWEVGGEVESINKRST